MSTWPPIPKMVRGASGPIKVRLARNVMHEGTECWGTWEPGKRRIDLDKSALPAHQWRTLYHELGHAALDDAGCSNLFTEAAVEMLVEAFATARMQELRGQLGIAD